MGHRCRSSPSSSWHPSQAPAPVTQSFDNVESRVKSPNPISSQEGTNVHFSNVHFVLCQIFGLNHLMPPHPCLLPPPPLYCFHPKWIKVGNHKPQEGSSNAGMSRRTKCTFKMCTFVTPWSRRTLTIRTETITNENLEIIFCFRFRNGKANKFPQIFFRICFRNDDVGHTQATTASHTYKTK